MSHYQTLGVDKTAPQAEIKKAYRKLSMQHHPDKGGDTKRFQEIADAYAILGNDEKRAQYDAAADNPFGNMFNNMGGMEGNFSDLFNQFYRGNAGFQQQQAKGNDVRVQIHINFTEAFYGVTKSFRIGSQPITMHIKSGAKNGQKFTIMGKGQPHPFNSQLPNGNVIVEVSVELSADNVIDGQNNIWREYSLPWFDIMTGCKITINTLDGQRSAIIAGGNNIIDSTDSSVIIGGEYNTVSGDRSVIIGGTTITGALDDMVYVPNLRVEGGLSKYSTDPSVITGFDNLTMVTKQYVDTAITNIPTYTADYCRGSKVSGNLTATYATADQIIPITIESENSNSTKFTVTGNGIRVNQAGRYRVNTSSSISALSNTARANPIVTITVNDITAVDANGQAYQSLEHYGRNAGSSQASTSQLDIILDLSENDIVKVVLEVGGINGDTGVVITSQGTHLEVSELVATQGTTGFTGTYTNGDGNTVTVTNGIITNIV